MDNVAPTRTISYQVSHSLSYVRIALTLFAATIGLRSTLSRLFT